MKTWEQVTFQPNKLNPMLNGLSNPNTNVSHTT